MTGARSLWRGERHEGRADGSSGHCDPSIRSRNSSRDTSTCMKSASKLRSGSPKRGCFAAEFNTIAIDDGIAMGHDRMLYSLPSRELIADSVEYMCNAHKADAMICISNCDKITPGMLMAAMRLNIPAVFVSGGTDGGRTYSGKSLRPDRRNGQRGRRYSFRTGISRGRAFRLPDLRLLFRNVHGQFDELPDRSARPFRCPATERSLATHAARTDLFRKAAKLIVKNANEYYFNDNDAVLPPFDRHAEAFLNAMSMDIAMGGSSNTVLHLLAIAQEAGVEFTMKDIDALSRRVPVICKVAPNSHHHIEDVNRAGGIMAILGELDRAGLLDTSVHRIDYPDLKSAIAANDILSATASEEAKARALAAPGGKFNLELGSQDNTYPRPIPTVNRAASATWSTLSQGRGGWPCCSATWPKTAASSKRPA